MNLAFKISVNEIVGTDSIADWVEDLRATGIEVEVLETPNQQTMALDWLLPTAIAAYIAKPYFNAMLSAAGKDHYAAIKRAISTKIQKKHLGETAEKVVTVQSEGLKKEQSLFSRTFSFTTSLRCGARETTVILLMPEGISSAEAIQAFDSFSRLMAESDEDELVRQLIALTTYGPMWPKTLWYNADSQAIELVDTVESSRTKKLVSVKIFERK